MLLLLADMNRAPEIKEFLEKIKGLCEKIYKCGFNYQMQHFNLWILSFNAT